MSVVTINGVSNLGTFFNSLLMSDDITFGSQPGYQLCKDIYLYHPLGAKIVEKVIEIAMSQKRNVSVPDGPETMVKDAFEAEWIKLGVNAKIFDVLRWMRVYGIASIGMLEKGKPLEDAVVFEKLYQADISFNVYDPLNTAGSLVLNQDPLAMDFQHVTGISVNGRAFHRSRSQTMMNESPVYIVYQSAAFGFTGRSVYQRALYPLKSFVNTMRADDMAARKVGLLVAMVQQGGSIMDNVMNAVTSFKRQLLKEAETDNVLSIGQEDKIESLNLQNLDGTLKTVRQDILENIASAVPMPAKLLTQETMAEGFGEGTEDAKMIAQFVDRFRENAKPIYDYFDKIVRYRAWNPDFYETVQKKFPEEYGGMPFDTAFYKWTNSFAVEWPSLLKEPDSELVKVDDVKLRAVVALLEVFLPLLDPANRIIAIEWACDAFNELKLLFGSPLNFDYDEMKSFSDDQQKKADEEHDANLEGMKKGGDEEEGATKIPGEPEAPKPFRADGAEKALINFRRALDSLGRQDNGKKHSRDRMQAG